MSKQALSEALNQQGRQERDERTDRFLREPPEGVTTCGPRARGPYDITVKIRSRAQLHRLAELLDGWLR